jgi:hypothetical protein
LIHERGANQTGNVNDAAEENERSGSEAVKELPQRVMMVSQR